MTHPLTSRICQEIIRDKGGSNYAHHFLEDQMRAAYNLAIEQITEKWEDVINSNKTDIKVIREFDKRLKEMRPQEEEP